MTRPVVVLVALVGVVIVLPAGILLQWPWKGPGNAPASDRLVPNPPVAPPLAAGQLSWRHAALPGVEAAGISEISRLAAIGDRSVGFATLRQVGEQQQSAVLVSDEGLAWLPVESPINDIRVGGTWLVGDALWAFGQSGPDEQPRHEIWSELGGRRAGRPARPRPGDCRRRRRSARSRCWRTHTW